MANAGVKSRVQTRAWEASKGFVDTIWCLGLTRWGIAISTLVSISEKRCTRDPVVAS